MITLPKNTGPDSCKRAQDELIAAMADPFTAVMIIIGEPPDIEEIKKVCNEAADVKPSTRKVVWVPDPTVLRDDQKNIYAPSGFVAVVIGLDKKVAATLTEDKAKLDIYVEEAFTNGEAQPPH